MNSDKDLQAILNWLTLQRKASITLEHFESKLKQLPDIDKLFSGWRLEKIKTSIEFVRNHLEGKK